MLLKLITVFSLFFLWRREVSANPQPQNVYTNTWRCLGNYKGLCSKAGCMVCAVSHSSYTSAFCFSLLHPVLYQMTQAQLKTDVGLRVAVSQPPQGGRFWPSMITTLSLLMGDTMVMGILWVGQLSWVTRACSFLALLPLAGNRGRRVCSFSRKGLFKTHK